MKKLLFVFAVLSAVMLCTMQAGAQKLMIGPRVGVNLANQAWDSTDINGLTKSSHLGIIAGASLDVWFDNMFALSTGLLFNQKGAHGEVDLSKTTRGFAAGTETADWTFSYLDIPIFLKVGFAAGDIKPYIFAGPSVGLKLAASEHLKAPATSIMGFSSPAMDSTASISDSLNAIDFAIVGGAGVAYIVNSTMQIFLDVSYSLGLSEVWKNKDYTGVGAIYSRDIRIMAGVMFGLN